MFIQNPSKRDSPSVQFNNMSRFLLMQNSRVLLEELTPSCEQLSLKLCTNRQIIKLPSSFHWSDTCQRWQSITHIRFEYFLEYPLELQFYLQRDKLPQVIGESTIQPPVFSHHLNEEIKVLISYDGLVTGWLYCEFAFEGQDTKAKEERFLSLQKVNLTFLEEIEEDIKIQIKRNTESIYQKVIKLTQRGKTLFPNIRMPVKVSDVIKMEITSISQVIKPIMFLVDRIKRGKSSTIQFWLRNKHKNKAGSVTVEYFMENLYLENQRHMRSRNAIIPDSLEYVKTIAAKRIADKEKDEQASEKEQVVMRRRLEEVDKRILKINNGVNQMLREMRKEDTIPFLKRSRPNRRSQLLDPSLKDKVSFYFESK